MINDDGYNCSDDGGETYQLSSSTFSRADESSLAFVGEEKLVVNLRRDVKVIMMVALMISVLSKMMLLVGIGWFLFGFCVGDLWSGTMSRISLQ